MLKWLLSLVVMAPLMSAVAYAGDSIPTTWDGIMNDPSIVKAPTAEDVREQAIQPTGEYQLFKVADKFAFLFDPAGEPMVAFDLTENHIGTVEALLGGIGIGEFSLYGLWKQLFSKKKKANDVDLMDSDQHSVIENTPEEIASGREAFKKFRFKKEFAQRHGYVGSMAEAEKNGVGGFEPTNFTLGDLHLEADQEAKIIDLYSKFGKVFHGQDLNESETREFMKEFELRWDDKNSKFDIAWKPGMSIMANKRPPMPDWVLNYLNPLDNLQYKYFLRSIENSAAGLEAILGNYAKILTIVISHTINGLKIRMDSHENTMLSLLEAAARDEYDLGVPLLGKRKFLEKTIDMIYLSKLVQSKDVTNGPAKRKQILQEESKAREKNLAWFEKKGYRVEVLPNNRFARVFKGNDELGIANIVIKPFFITRKPMMNYNAKSPYAMRWTRTALDAVTAAVRYWVPTSIYFGKWLADWFAVSISIYIPGAFWDSLIQGTRFVQTGYEGELIGLVGESMAGRYKKLSFTEEQSKTLYSALYLQRINPFEIYLKNENAEKAKNWQDILNLLSGGNVQRGEVQFSYSH